MSFSLENQEFTHCGGIVEKIGWLSNCIHTILIAFSSAFSLEIHILIKSSTSL
jgi:hypothetical protein